VSGLPLEGVLVALGAEESLFPQPVKRKPANSKEVVAKFTKFIVVGRFDVIDRRATPIQPVRSLGREPDYGVGTTGAALVEGTVGTVGSAAFSLQPMRTNDTARVRNTNSFIVLLRCF